MQSLFEKYINGNCSDEEYQQVLKFIQDKNNDLQLDKMLHEDWAQHLQNEQSIKPDIKLLDSIHHQIALKEQNPSRMIRIYQSLLSAAAVLIIGLVIGSLFFIQTQKPEITTQNISTPYGGKTQFTLPDGSTVWLNSGSTFSYPDRFEGQRIVDLTGEAYFNVEKQKDPFIVKTQFGQVEVLGTEFNVKAYQNETFLTTLESGSVVFTNKYGKQAYLEPGMQVVFDDANFKLRRVETKLFTSWKDGQLIFRDEPLQNIVTRLERWYNVKIELKDERIKNLKYTGTIEMETFSEVLELIKVTTPIKYTFDRKTRILTISSP
jgi:ferric-dicitrate binding protein FerR (iron transport regulator)